MVKKRVYKKGAPGSEYDAYHGTPEQKKRRGQRNKARADLGLGVGNPQEAGHVKAKRTGPLPKKAKPQSFASNRADQPKRGKGKV